MAVAANPTLLAFPNGFDHTQKTTIVRGRIAPTGSYVSGGFTILPSLQPLLTTGESLNVPFEMELWSDHPNAATAIFFYTYDASTQLIQIWVSAASGNPVAELAAGALPAGVTGDKVRFEAYFQKGFGPQAAYPF